MKILITGGAGFIGQHLARRLTRAGHSVLALDTLAPQVHADPDHDMSRFPGPVVVGDVAESSAWDLPDTPDAVVHLAAETGTGQSMYEQQRYHRANVGGTTLAGEAACRWDVPIVSVSSRAVYGNGPVECPRHGRSFDGSCCALGRPASSQELDPHLPVSVYGETKSLAESALDGAAALVPVTIIRPQNVVGPGQALHNPYTGVLAAFLARLREGRPLQVYGDGTASRDFIHVDDVTALLAWCLDNPPAPGDPLVLNSGTGSRTTMTDVAAAAIAGSRRSKAAVEYVDVRRAGDIDHACADLTRAWEVGAPRAEWTSTAAIRDFIEKSWEGHGVESAAWDRALEELSQRGLTR